MSRSILKNVIWGAVDFAALPAVAILAYATGEHDRVRSLSKDLDSRLDAISADIVKIKEEQKDKQEQQEEDIFTDAKDGNLSRQEDDVEDTCQ